MKFWGNKIEFVLNLLRLCQVTKILLYLIICMCTTVFENNLMSNSWARSERFADSFKRRTQNQNYFKLRRNWLLFYTFFISFLILLFLNINNFNITFSHHIQTICGFKNLNNCRVYKSCYDIINNRINARY